MDQSDDRPRVAFLHKVFCAGGNHHSEHPHESWFWDVPRLFAGDNKKSALRGKTPAESPSAYIDRHWGHREEEDESEDSSVESESDEEEQDPVAAEKARKEARQTEAIRHLIIVVVERSYECIRYHEQVKKDFKLSEAQPIARNVHRKLRPYLYVLGQDAHEAQHYSETMTISNYTLLSTLRNMVIDTPYYFTQPHLPETFVTPYLPFFWLREPIKRKIAELDNVTLRAQLVVFLQHVLEACKSNYQKADALFALGKVNQAQFSKLFAPNEILVSETSGHPVAYMNNSVLVTEGGPHQLNCWSWTFDGTFRRESVKIQVAWPAAQRGETIDITSLKFYPLRFAKPEIRELLERRGRQIWGCRRQAYVSYCAPNLNFDVQMANPRFMVDMRMYNELHTETDESKAEENEKHALAAEYLDSDEPPDDTFVYLLPDTVVGYGFHDKKWKTLQADYITDIQWQTEAFERLVLDQNKKDIIQALVSVHADTVVLNEPHDIIEGKGNGLILLLHGSPGTGKTLTAESIAELTRKPLYRVTCGDIGVEPEGVEKYLDSVLYIGTVWGCVILLDEADVFLEERTQADLQRNALVSVFLRVLEYYNGILILTTNRVGTFDEAFKSRIQLSIHYPPLNLQSRVEIWLNFFSAMKHDGNADIAGLKRKAEFLGRYRINGRQIRNTVKSAKQLAYYKKEKLNYSHFDRVIRIADEFDRYIERAHGGNTDEEWAVDAHIRAGDIAEDD
ncbi:AAA family ATPase [Xylariaceae sp. FL1272]|nr:AAA family ATPase [Xylariaceae sp. FL1272]